MAIHTFKCKTCSSVIWAMSEDGLHHKLMWHLVKQHKHESGTAALVATRWLNAEG